MMMGCSGVHFSSIGSAANSTSRIGTTPSEQVLVFAVSASCSTVVTSGNTTGVQRLTSHPA